MDFIASGPSDDRSTVVWSQPDHLAVIAMLCGLAPRLASRARVLELGCAAGEHLIALAARYPQARFIGIETDRAQVEQANRSIETLGLTNIAVARAEFASMQHAGEGEPFDYIICGGAYSLASDAERAALLRLCHEHLAGDGVAYFGYDTYPGWKAREVLGEAMRFHARATSDPRDRLSRARSMLELTRDVAHAKTAYGRMLINEAARLAAGDERLLQEFLEARARPCYFRDFMAQAQTHQLAFLGEAVLPDWASSQRSRKMQVALQSLADGDVLAAEQYLDLLRNRFTRQTLLVHAAAAHRIDRKLRPQAMERLHSSCAFGPIAPDSPYAQEREFGHPGGRTLKTANLAIQAMMLAWAQAYPRSLSFADLMEATQHKRFGQIELPSRVHVAEALLRLAVEGIVHLHAEPIEAGRAREARPRAFAPALAAVRAEPAGVAWTVINLRHEPIVLEAREAMVLALLDGTVDAVQLREHLVVQAQQGSLPLDLELEAEGQAQQNPQQAPGDAPRPASGSDQAVALTLRATAAGIVLRALQRFEQTALLLPSVAAIARAVDAAGAVVQAANSAGVSGPDGSKRSPISDRSR